MQGSHFNEYPVYMPKIFAITTMGNLGLSNEFHVAYIDMKESADDQLMNITCPNNKYIGDLMKFGLARQNEYVTGFE